MNPYDINHFKPEVRDHIKKHRDESANGQLWKLLKYPTDFEQPTDFDLTVTYLGLNNNPEWEADKWNVTIKYGSHNYSFEYKTGFGHRVGYMEQRRSPGLTGNEKKTMVNKAKLQGYKDGHRIVKLPGTHAFDEEYVTKPNLADILYCMLMNRTCGELFDDWCASLGYDTDSRKALDIYLVCQESELNFNRLFSQAQIESIEKILEDY